MQKVRLVSFYTLRKRGGKMAVNVVSKAYSWEQRHRNPGLPYLPYILVAFF